ASSSASICSLRVDLSVSVFNWVPWFSGFPGGYCGHYALHDCEWCRRAAGNCDVDGNHVRHTPATRVTLAEDAAGTTAIAERNDQLRFRRCIVCPPQR